MSIMNIMLIFLLSFLPFTQTMNQCFGLAFMEAGGSMNDYGTKPYPQKLLVTRIEISYRENDTQSPTIGKVSHSDRR